jgi:hypothetical protein
VSSRNLGAESWGDTILNSHCRHSPLVGAAETRIMNAGNMQDSASEELRAAHGQEIKYGVPGIPLSTVSIAWYVRDCRAIKAIAPFPASTTQGASQQF